MRKIRKVMILFACVILFWGCANRYDNENKSYESMKNEIEKNKSMNICVISASKHDGMWGYSAGASGIVIGKDADGYYALTANHVVNKKKTKFLIMTVFDPDIKEYRKKHPDMKITSVGEYYDRFPVAQVIYTNQNEDLAILYFETKEELAIADISKDNPQKNDLVITVGTYSEKNEKFYESIGKIKKDELVSFVTDDQFGETQVFQHSAFTAEGFSGGGVYNSEMKLVGLNIGGGTNILGGFKYSAMIPCEQIQKCIVDSNISELQDKEDDVN